MQKRAKNEVLVILSSMNGLTGLRLQPYNDRTKCFSTFGNRGVRLVELV